ncbi:MAG TPA: sugar ABC transporter ATP-binding protein [Kineosporiaceae bacterium]
MREDRELDDGSGPPLLRARGIRVSFGGVEALRGVDFELRSGQIHALLGGNGAGKSTLMNVIGGVITRYRGRFELDGRCVRFGSPRDAQRAGVSTVYQELDLVPGLTVADNLVLAREPVGRAGLFVRSPDALVARPLERVAAPCSPRAVVGGLRLGERQLVAIAKALYDEAKILILDEPTAALTSQEVQVLFEALRGLREQGVGIVFISHRLEEIPQIADTVTVLRDGAVVARAAPDTPALELTRLLTGRRHGQLYPPKADPSRSGSPGRERLRLRGFGYQLSRPRTGWTEPVDVDVTVRAGEVVGLAGLLGAGRSELLEALTGAAPRGRAVGRVEVDGQPLRVGGVRRAQRRGIGYVPDDRHRSGFVAQASIADNLTMACLDSLCTAGFVRTRKARAATAWAFQELGIVAASPEAGILSLSGGNQQKVVMGRALLRNPGLLLLDEPTRGVDVGAKADIYRLIRRLTLDGLAVLVASSELPELIGLCDRLVVLASGRVVAEVPASTEAVPTILDVLDQPMPSNRSLKEPA